MNEPTIRLEPRPEVTGFVARVRARLADLTDEEREELVGGLEGDLHELVADGGSVAELGDPRAYADELRSAAGLARPLPESTAVAGPVPPMRRRLAGLTGRALDRAHQRWRELVAVPALRGAWEVVVALRPVWWVLRAWAAVQLLLLVTGTTDSVDLVPSWGPSFMGPGLLLAAVVGSVQVGRGRLWPGTHLSAVLPRLLLLGLNGLAVLVLLVTAPLVPSQEQLDRSFESGYDAGSGGDVGASGLAHDGVPVANVFPYDADGRPLEGVQLFDQDGRPLSVSRSAGEEYDEVGERVTVTYPWFNGVQQLYNVFPLPRRVQPAYPAGRQLDAEAWTSTNPPALPTPPLAVVPPAALPTLDQDVPDGRQTPGAGEAGPDEADSENPEGR